MGGRARLARTLPESLATALADPHVRAVEIGWTLHTTASMALLVVGLLVAYDVAGAAGVAALTIVRMVPATATTLLVDVARFPRLEGALAGIHLLVGIAAAAAAAAILAGSPLAAFLAIGLAAGAGALVRPTQLALVPALATRPEQLLSANVAMLLGEGAGAFVGPLVAGLVVATAGAGAGAGLAAGLAIAAGVAILPVRVADAARAHRRGRTGAPPVVDGLRALAARPAAAVVVGSFAAQVLVRGALLTLLVLLAIEVLGAGEAGVGLLNAVVGLGGLVGAVAALALAAGTRLAPWFALALVAWGVPLVVIGAVPTAAVALAGLGVVGVANALLDVSGFTLLQRAVPAGVRGAVFAVLESTIGLCVAAGGLLAALLVPVVGIAGSIALAGAVLPVAALLGWGVVRRLDDEQVVPRETAALLRGVALFAALPLDGLERVASAMRPVRFDPGEALMTEGEPGDRYLLLAGGRATVSRGGRQIGVVGPGAGVGEIALLRAVPRTATVTAVEPVEAWALGCEAFVAAVSGHDAAARAATEVVEGRLEADRARDAGHESVP